jgi:hypothetical protein
MSGAPHYSHLLWAQREGALWHPLMRVLGRERPQDLGRVRLMSASPRVLEVERHLIGTLYLALSTEFGEPRGEGDPGYDVVRVLARALQLNMHAQRAVDEQRASDVIGSAGIPRWAPGVTVIFKPGERL